MNKVLKRGFVVCALAASAALVIAQGAGPGQGGAQGGGQGQGRGGRAGGGGFNQRAGQFGGLQNELALALRADVQRDIKVTDDQKKKLEELQAKQREARRGQGGGQNRGAGGGGAAGGGAGAGGGQNRGNFDPAQLQAMRERQAQQRAEMLKALGEILNADQMKRVGEISVQLRGNRALFDADVQKALGLSTEQVGKLEDLQRKQREANQAIMEKARNQEISREEAQASRERNEKILDEELGKVLNGDQTTKFKAMQGAPFKADAPQRGGGGN